MAKGLQSRKKQRLVVLTTALTAFIGAVLLVLFALGSDSLSLFMQPTEAMDKKLPVGQNFRLGGLVKTGTLARQQDGLTYQFSITDCVTDVSVEFHGILPDLFREGQGVVTEGSFNTSGIFRAETVLAKHDENYMPPESAPKNPDACQHPDQQGMGQSSNMVGLLW